MSDSSRLPANPSFEQLQKLAKELLKQYRAGDSAAMQRLAGQGESPTLADAQFVIAREHGFESWAKLKRHIESLDSIDLEQFKKLARDVAAAYSGGDAQAIRELNWNLGTWFVHDYDPEKMKRRLSTWYASESRTPEVALADAQQMVAKSYGFESWAKFADSVASAPRKAPAARTGLGSGPPFYRIDWKQNALGVRGPTTEKDWDAICEVMADHEITCLFAGGMTDAGMERVSKLRHVTKLFLGNSNLLTDDGLLHVGRMPQIEELAVGGPKSITTDRGLMVLGSLPRLRRFYLSWSGKVSDEGVGNVSSCEHLEIVDLMGTPTGDGALRALAGKKRLRQLKTGRQVTDEGLALLHEFPVFKAWQGGQPKYDLMSFEAEPNHLLLDGPFTNAGLASLAGLDGLFGLGFFWHCPGFTSAGLRSLHELTNLGFLGCQDTHCDDEAMEHIAAVPRLRMLMGQGAVASDTGWEALSRSKTLEYIWGRECPNLTSRGFRALAGMPTLRGLGVSCKNVDDAALSLLPNFPALRELMPMDVPDAGFRHVGRCDQLEDLWCMYCRETGDAATEHIAGLKLKKYYAGQTKITDRSLEILGRMDSLERLEFWDCSGITNAGVAHLTRLPRLREIVLGAPNVTRDAHALFPAHVQVS